VTYVRDLGFTSWFLLKVTVLGELSDPKSKDTNILLIVGVLKYKICILNPSMTLKFKFQQPPRNEGVSLYSTPNALTAVQSTEAASV